MKGILTQKKIQDFMMITTDSDPISESQEPLSFLKFFFNCCYFSCFVPFKVKWEKKSTKFTLINWKIQTVLCGILHLFFIGYSIFCLCFRYYLIIKNVHPSDPSFVNTVFSTICNFTLQIFYLLFIKSMWCDRIQVVNMINAVTVKKLGENKVFQINKWLKIVGIVGFATVTVFNIHNAQFSLDSDSEKLANYTWLGLPPKAWASLNNFWLYAEVVITTFSFINHLFVLVLSCGLAAMAWEFQNYLNNEGVEKGIDLYRSLKRNVHLVNEAWGGKFLAFAIVLISYYGTLPDILMAYIAEEPPVSVLVYAFVNTVGWVVAAKFHATVQQTFLAWSEASLFESSPAWNCIENENDIKKIHSSASLSRLLQIVSGFDRQMKLSAIRQEVQTEPIALSCEFFSVTNSFLCSIISLIMTYSIILFQTRTSK